MSSYFNKWNISSKWFQMGSAMKRCLRKDTNHRQALQKCCADFKGNHHVCGHRRNSVSLAGRSWLATGSQLHSSTRAWEILGQHRARASFPPWKDIGSSEGFLWMCWIWQGCSNILISHIAWNFWSWQCQPWDTASQAAKATVPGLKGYSHGDLGKNLPALSGSWHRLWA